MRWHTSRGFLVVGVGLLIFPASAGAQAVGNEFQVNTTTAGDQKMPTVALDGAGDFVVAWTNGPLYDTDIRSQRFDAAGTPQGGEFQVNTHPGTLIGYPAVGLDGPGNFVVVWDDFGPEGVAAQLYLAEGAALGTGTAMEYEVIHGIYDLMPNETVSHLMDANLRNVGGLEYSEAERAFARQIQATFEGGPSSPLGSEAEIQEFGLQSAGGSTDVGDISWVVPTAGLSTATWVPGTSAHSWQAVAAGGMSIGTKGMLVAAKTLALTAIDLFQSPDVIREAWAELERRRGPDFTYVSLLGDRAPPLDYRR